ncbi:MAG: translation initiation factor IF-2, partial [Anaerolineae bacterium]
GKVRAMFDDRGNRIKQAGPSTPVAILGFPVVPLAGERFEVVASEHAAREMVSERLAAERAADKQQRRTISLEEVFSRMQSGETKEINIVLKADVQGSIEPIVKSVCGLGGQECRVHFLRQGTGNITESDVMLAVASSAIVIGFNVSVDSAAQRLAEAEGVDIRLYNVIYRLVEDLDKALKGKLEPTYQEVVTGHAEVRAIFKISRRGNVAGAYVLDGQITRNSPARLLRNGERVYESTIASLRRFTEDVAEVNAGYECGITLENFQDYQVGDIIECYKKERVS